ncbi:TPA: hypothetical protein I9774_000564 [Serratia marcescens]|nr:hypothetical protein [Serratia marcescens]
MTLTTEQLRAIAEEELDACTTLDAAKLMARELLANREAQPVFFIEIEGDDWVNAGRIEGENRPDLGLLPDGINYLYTAPLALPVQHWEELCRQHPNMSIGDAIIRAAWWNHCRAELLNKGAPPAPAVPEISHSSVVAEQLAHVLSNMEVTDHQRAIISCAVDRLNKTAEVLQQKPTAIASPGDLDYQGAKELFNYLMTEEEINATVNGWNACRAAMLAAAPDGGNG